jgi:PAS domain S-box-containing protein
MTGRSTGRPRVLGLAEAAEFLRLPVAAVEALVGAGYLTPATGSAAEPGFHVGELKAFLARNADSGSGNLFPTEPPSADPADLLEALDGRSADMARRAFEIFSTAFPETAGWDDAARARFVEQAKNRFEAILAITSQGVEVDEALVDDLQAVGASAAWSGSPLPQLLVVLRISRDLVVQTAVELAEERGRHWSMALSLLLTRVLPAMDRLTDALAQGYWSATLGREGEQKERYEHVVEHSSDGVYEVDLDGRIQYANRSLAVILGRPLDELHGADLTEVLVPVAGGSVERLLVEPPGAPEHLELVVARPDGVRRVLEVRPLPRRRDGELAGFQGVVRDVTTARDLEADKNQFLAVVTSDLRHPATTVLDLGATLEAQAGELAAERIRRIGASVQLEAERISRLADDLQELSRVQARSLSVSPRRLDLAATVEAVMAGVSGGRDVVVAVPPGVEVLADDRLLEQVLAHLVENALTHGAPPVRVGVAEVAATGVEVAVTDHGPGVPPELASAPFDRLWLLARRDRAPGSGLGLPLVKGLVEAMGGRVRYERGPGGGADFRFTLPQAGEAAVG